MSKIKVFQFPIANSYGGITHYAINNWKYMDKSVFSCDFGTVSPNLSFEKEIVDASASIRYFSCNAETDRGLFIQEMTDLFKKEKYDVVHLHTSYWKSFTVEDIARKCGVPKIIVHSHSTYIDLVNSSDRKNAMRQHIKLRDEFNENMATDFCACSNAAAKWLFGEQISPKKIKILRNAIDVEDFNFNFNTRNQYRENLGLNDSFVIGNVGRLSHQKNQEFLLKVFSKIVQKVPNAKLVIVGDGPLKEKLTFLSGELGIMDKVLFLGKRNDVNKILQAIDVFCLPSLFEGLGIVAIEAQCAGLPCIVNESIPSEVVATDKCIRMALDEKLWCEQLVDLSISCSRSSMYDQITVSGYNIRNQIKEIENIYLS